MKYSVCIDSVFPGKTPEEALECIRESGLEHYEFWGWWDRDCDALLRAQQKTGITPAAMCTRMISLTDPSQRQAYLEGLRETIAVCEKLSCRTIISQVGAELQEVSRKEQHQSIVDGLTACKPLLTGHDVTLAIEPLNTKFDHPGYYLTSSREAFDIVEEVCHPQIKVLFDIYHQHIMEGISIPYIIRHLEQIAHFHIAGFPGRHEPLDPNEIDYPEILKAIREGGYQKGAGLEYFPVKDAKTGLIRWHTCFGSPSRKPD